MSIDNKRRVRKIGPHLQQPVNMCMGKHKRVNIQIYKYFTDRYTQTQGVWDGLLSTSSALIPTEGNNDQILLCQCVSVWTGMFRRSSQTFFLIANAGKTHKCPIGSCLLVLLALLFFCSCFMHIEAAFTDRGVCVAFLAPYWMIAGKHCQSKERQD